MSIEAEQSQVDQQQTADAIDAPAIVAPAANSNNRANASSLIAAVFCNPLLWLTLGIAGFLAMTEFRPTLPLLAIGAHLIIVALSLIIASSKLRDNHRRVLVLRQMLHNEKAAAADREAASQAQINAVIDNLQKELRAQLAIERIEREHLAKAVETEQIRSQQVENDIQLLLATTAEHTTTFDELKSVATQSQASSQQAQQDIAELQIRLDNCEQQLQSSANHDANQFNQLDALMHLHTADTIEKTTEVVSDMLDTIDPNNKSATLDLKSNSRGDTERLASALDISLIDLASTDEIEDEVDAPANTHTSIEIDTSEIETIADTSEGTIATVKPSNTDNRGNFEEFSPTELFHNLDAALKKQNLPIATSIELDKSLPGFVRGFKSSLGQLLGQLMRSALAHVQSGSLILRASQTRIMKHTIVLDAALRHEVDGELTDQLSPMVSNRSANGFMSQARPLLERLGGQARVETMDDDSTIVHLTFVCDRLDSASDHRDFIRLPQEMLKCNLGEILDMSLGGLRILCTRRRAPSGEVDITIESDSGSLEIRGEVVWDCERPNRRKEFGVRFLDVTEELAGRLTEISMMHRRRGSLRSADRD